MLPKTKNKNELVELIVLNRSATFHLGGHHSITGREGEGAGVFGLENKLLSSLPTSRTWFLSQNKNKTFISLSWNFIFVHKAGSKNSRLSIDLEVNPLTAKLFNLNFHPLEVVSRWRDPQLQVSENYWNLAKLRSTVFKYCWLMSHFIFVTCLKGGTWCANKKWKPEYMRHRRLRGYITTRIATKYLFTSLFWT